MSRERLFRLRSRLLIALLATSSIAAGVIAGCGIDAVGSFGTAEGVDATTENVGPSLPPEGGGGDGPSGDAGADADADASFAVACATTACVDAGGYCDDAGTNACVITCTGSGSCATGVTCPPDVPCKVSCASNDSCPGPIDCKNAASCDIECAKHACAGIACGGSTCAVRCTGDDSCINGAVTCNAKDSCSIECSGGGSSTCEDPVTCTSASCNVSCGKDACKGGVTTFAADAGITCGMNACGPAARCVGSSSCQLACRSGSCTDKLCCDGGTCLYDGGNGDGCPPF